jgi:shikimate dehydrogenase
VDQGKELIRLALFGQPVKSSLSPAIHRRFAEHFGLTIEYRLIEPGVGGFPDDFPGALEAFRLAGGVGCNVTLPFKRQAWQLATESSAEVSQAQAANTLVYRASSGWIAYTTDGAGLIADLTENHHLDLLDQRILILGAGGAAAGILGSLLAQQPREIVVVNRNLERAVALSQRFESPGRGSATSWADLALQGSFDLVINATSLGHHGQAPELIPSLFSPGAVCYDLNYNRASLSIGHTNAILTESLMY